MGIQFSDSDYEVFAQAAEKEKAGDTVPMVYLSIARVYCWFNEAEKAIKIQNSPVRQRLKRKRRSRRRRKAPQ